MQPMSRLRSGCARRAQGAIDVDGKEQRSSLALGITCANEQASDASREVNWRSFWNANQRERRNAGCGYITRRRKARERVGRGADS